MSGHGTTHALVVEQAVQGPAEQAGRRFAEDPAHWLPGRMLMHGGARFHTRIPLLGMAVEIESVVGTPWNRGDVTTRSLHVEAFTPPYGTAWLLPTVDGELSLLRTDGDALLRFESGRRHGRRVDPRRLTAPWLVRRLLAGVARRLAGGSTAPGSAT
jgi:hypothetical protein